jgi:hypothetical protein
MEYWEEQYKTSMRGVLALRLMASQKVVTPVE